MTRRMVYTVLGFAFVSVTLATAAPPKDDKVEPWWWNTLGIDPDVPFDPKKMDELVESAAKASNNGRGLMRAIMQVTAQKDPRFRGLISRADLRKRRNLDLALCAYDYAINDSEKALGRLIDLDSEQKLGGDYVSIAIMGMIDEWDRTIESVWRHKAHSDGTAGTTASIFFECKKQLFPESFAKFRESIDTERKVIERLAATVADDPKLDHDHGKCYQFYGVPKGVPPEYKWSASFCVKELPREGADPLIFVGLGRARSDAVRQRNWILAPVIVEDGGPRVWKDVTDEVLPGKEFHSMGLRARRSDNVIETSPLVFVNERRDRAHLGPRGVDLVWKGGKFLVRRQDGENWTGKSRAPYKPSR